MRGAATGKARLPTVESLTEGTNRRLVPAERSPTQFVNTEHCEGKGAKNSDVG